MLPFSLLGFDCDNGSEFLNWHLMRYLSDNRKQKVQFTRSRPYKKNDNAHVEQKNWTHVRQLFGYDRFDQPILVGLMNELYSNEWSLYQNHFIPKQKLISKEKINSKYGKKYEKAKTPYQRILDSPHVTDEKKAELALLHQTLNPFEPKRKIKKNCIRFFVTLLSTQNRVPKFKSNLWMILRPVLTKLMDEMRINRIIQLQF